MKRGFFLYFGLMTLAYMIFVGVRSGYFSKTEIEQTKTTDFYLAYAEVNGPYNKILTSLEKVEGLIQQKFSIQSCTSSFGLYWNNPKTTNPKDLKSWVGCVLKASEFKELQSHQPQALTDNTSTIQGIKLKHLPPFFAFKGTYRGSPSMTPLKVYPKLFKALKNSVKKPEIEASFSPILEIYSTEPPKNDYVTNVFIQYGDGFLKQYPKAY